MSESNSKKDLDNNINSNKIPHPLETEQPIIETKEKEKSEKEQKKNSLLFDQKDISPIKLYCHLSGKLEIIFMILGFIGSIGAGSAGPLISLLNGSTVNNFRDSTITYTGSKDVIMDELKKEIDRKVRLYLIMGTVMF